ncbi:response regulator [Chitinimonas viridis]|uniref:Response regulator n=2 Tax=Chitinimonas TaxID=240411 RepID=A0ABT8B201_9NEIS|nr:MULTISPECIES: response regulator [Chitinimonas]MBL8507975.1 response regulator [Chitinimonas sp.]MDN3575519.1 response regulator [Chitinimonas viridis]GLR11272.1 two-component system response regulator [Chitinimonas prasina]
MQTPILLVEDNPDDEALTIRAFGKNGIQNPIVVARDGQEAIDYLYGQGSHTGRDVSELPVLILLDIKLPKLNGIEVLRQIRSNESTRLIPVVVLTTSKEEDDLVKSYSLGANSYIRKPVDFMQFMEVVKQVGIYWLMLNEPVQG